MNSRQVHRPNRAGCVSNQTGNVSGCLTRQVQMSRALIHKTGSLLGLRGSGASVRGTPHVAPDTGDKAPAAAWGQWAQHSISGITRVELRMAESTSVGSLPQFPLIVFQARTGNAQVTGRTEFHKQSQLSSQLGGSHAQMSWCFTTAPGNSPPS